MLKYSFNASCVRVVDDKLDDKLDDIINLDILDNIDDIKLFYVI